MKRMRDENLEVENGDEFFFYYYTIAINQRLLLAY